MVADRIPGEPEEPEKQKKAKKPQKPFRMTPAIAILLHGTPDMPIGLLHLQMARADQLCRLHYSMKSLKAVKAKLYALEGAGYVEVDAVPTKFAKSPYVYMLTKKGINYLAEIGYDVNTSYRPDKDTNRHSLFIEHTLEVNDVLIAAALLKRSNPDIWLESFVHERVLKHKPYKANIMGETFTLIPDGLLDFRIKQPDGSISQLPILLELDRGTEEQFYFRKRLRAYVMMLQTENYRSLIEAKGIKVLFVTTKGLARLNKMREWTWKELAAIGVDESLEQTFYFTSWTQELGEKRLWLEPTWYNAYDVQALLPMGV